MPNLPKHHFVPWSYLRYFTIDPNEHRKTSTIHMWDKIASVGSIQKTDRVKCYVRGQNTIEHLLEPEFYEQRYAKIDADFGEILGLLLRTARLEAWGSKLNPQNKDVLARHFMLLYKRQPTVLYDAFAKTNNALNIVAEMMRSEYKDILPAPVIERILTAKNAKQYALELSMVPVGEGVEALLKKVWIYCRNETGIPFITSDYPLCLQLISSYNGKGMPDPGCLFFFPVAPDVLVYMIDPIHFTPKQKEYFDNAVVSVPNRDFVLVANDLQHSNCARQIYANKPLSPDIFVHPDDLLRKQPC